ERPHRLEGPVSGRGDGEPGRGELGNAHARMLAQRRGGAGPLRPGVTGFFPRPEFFGDPGHSAHRRGSGHDRMTVMPAPWTSSASAALDSGSVTLVEGSAFCISYAVFCLKKKKAHGLFFRDTRFVSELRLRDNSRWP